MYRRKTRKVICSHLEDAPIPFESTEEYRSLGYYVLGGLDITGDHLRLDASVSYDSEEDISAGCSVDSLCDPRTSFFDVAEAVGVDCAERMAEELANQK